MIDNINIVKQLLKFENNGDFYPLYIFQRRKDQPKGTMSQNVRIIKMYTVNSIEYLENRYEEIKGLCDYFNARAYIKVIRNNHNDVGLEMIKEVSNRLQNDNNQMHHVFDKVVGRIKTYDKRWLVDIDTKDESLIQSVIDCISQCKPVGCKLVARVPTKNGVHIITNRFNVVEFKKQHPTIDIQKNSPTVLYCS